MRKGSIVGSDIKTYRDLITWQKAFRLSVDLYAITGDFPDSEKYGLCSQIRRCGVSVPSNIAEGYGRGTTPEYIRFLRVARGSLCELETQIFIAEELNFIPASQFEVIHDQIEECHRLLAGLLRSLNK